MSFALHDSLKHVGIIPDGTRRWATTNRLQKQRAYRLTAEKVAEIIDYLFAQGITSVSSYMLSKENLKRGSEDIEPILGQIPYFYQKILPRITERWHASVIHAGSYQALSGDYQDMIQKTCAETKPQESSGRRIYLCLAYCPLDELAHALASAPRPRDFWDHLWVPETVDLVIRTGGDTTLSNFLPLQCGYARIYTIDKFFPDVDTADIERALQSYRASPRLYGR